MKDKKENMDSRLNTKFGMALQFGNKHLLILVLPFFASQKMLLKRNLSFLIDFGVFRNITDTRNYSFHSKV